MKVLGRAMKYIHIAVCIIAIVVETRFAIMALGMQFEKTPDYTIFSASDDMAATVIVIAIMTTCIHLSYFINANFFIPNTSVNGNDDSTDMEMRSRGN